MCLLGLSLAVAVAAIMATSALAMASAAQAASQQARELVALAAYEEGPPPAGGWQGIRRIAFGSCTSYDIRPQPIWTQGVVPARPDAWVWLGDMVGGWGGWLTPWGGRAAHVPWPWPRARRGFARRGMHRCRTCRTLLAPPCSTCCQQPSPQPSAGPRAPLALFVGMHAHGLPLRPPPP